MAVNPQFKITQIAKDLGKKSKDLVSLLADKGFDIKTTQKTLEAVEFDVLFDTLTKENQIVEIENYLDGITYIPSKAKKEAVVEVPKAVEAKPAEKKEEKPVEAKVEKPVQPKAEKPVETKAQQPEVKKAGKPAEAPKAPEAQKSAASVKPAAQPKPEDKKAAPTPAPRAQTQAAPAPRAPMQEIGRAHV